MPAPEKTKVLLVEDHPMFRERLAHLLGKDGTMTVCAECDNIRDAHDAITRTQPDIAIVDLTLRGASGLDLIKDLKARGDSLPVLVLSMHDETLYAERVLRAGARGYITKHEASAEVMAAIRCVLAGEIYLSPQMTGKVLKKLAENGSQPAGNDVNSLTDRELEVFRLIGTGCPSRSIAAKLRLGAATVDTYRARIKEKLGLRNGAELHTAAARWVAKA